VRGRLDGARHVERLVVRMPPDGPTLFPAHDLGLEVAVQAIASRHGVPVPTPQHVVDDPAWLGRPFLVMPLVDGHCIGPAELADEWLMSLPADGQRRLHDGFLDAVAAIHRIDVAADLPVGVRGVGSGLDAEIDWWAEYARWSFGGDAGVLLELLEWCRAHRPDEEPPGVLLWGDVRLGNVIIGDDRQPKALLDWEMACFGPPEHDVAWYTALVEATEHFLPGRPPGFRTREEIVESHARALGRPLVAFRWFEIFALTRASIISARERALARARRDRQPRSPAENGTVRYARSVVAAESGS
jgi:aminoglycoside phosphotransferase (APT) family kinase protein